MCEIGRRLTTRCHFDSPLSLPSSTHKAQNPRLFPSFRRMKAYRCGKRAGFVVLEPSLFAAPGPGSGILASKGAPRAPKTGAIYGPHGGTKAIGAFQTPKTMRFESYPKWLLYGSSTLL